jgi:hypothetical protein
LRRASDAKLISARDAGLCAPRARAGRRYVVRARYRTRDEAHLIAYVRDRGGAWRYFRQSPALRPGPRWRTGRWTTPRLPRGTTALSVGISLREAGTLTVGHFALSAR